MGLNSSNSLFNDEEDYNYEIDSTQNLQGTQSKFMNSMDNFPNVNSQKDNSTYISQLEYKIRDQAKRLSELEKYKYLCERRIKQLNPNHPLPLTEEILEIPIQKDEIIDIEEQKNYYDLLRKTIENDLLKNGVLNKYINVDGVLELAKIKNECEEYRKQLVLAQSMINSLKSDVEDLIKENNILKNKKNLNDSKDYINISNVSNEIKRKISDLTQENIKLNQELNNFKENSILKGENNLDFKRNDLQKNDDNIIGNFNKILYDYKINYDKVNYDFENLLKEKGDLQKNNIQLQNEIHLYQEQIYSLEVQIDKLNSELNEQKERIINDEYKNMYNDLLIENQNLKKVLNNNNTSENFNNENEITNYSILPSEINKLQIEKEKMKIDLDNLLSEKKSLEKENEINHSQIKNLNIEKVKIQLENTELKNELSNIKEKYSIELTNKSSIIDNYKEEISKYKIEKNENKIEQISLNDIYSQSIQKYNSLNFKFEELITKYNSLTNKYEKIKNEKELLEKKLDFNENELKTLKSECKQYKDENNIIKLNESNLKIMVEQKENKVNETMNYSGKINRQIKELETELEEKDNIILTLKKTKKDFENIVSDKLNNFDDYITNNKSYINNLMNKLIEFSLSFEKLVKKDLNNNIFTKEFLNGVSKVITQINSINKIQNYNVQLNDEIFFETIDLFITIISNELINIYDISQFNKLETESKYSNLNDEKITNINNINSQINNLIKDRDNIFDNYSKIKERNLKLEKDFIKLKNNYKDLETKYNDSNFKLSQSEKTFEMNNKSRRNLYLIIKKFIRLFPFKELTRIMLEIINISEQISNDELNKYLIEDKISLMKNNYNNFSKQIDNDINSIIKKEYDNLKRLLNDIENKILIKNEKLKELNEEYEKYKTIFNDKLSADINKTIKLNYDNIELKSRIKDLESSIEFLNKNNMTNETNFLFNKIEPNDIFINTDINKSYQFKNKTRNNNNNNLFNNESSLNKKLELYSVDFGLLNHQKLNNFEKENNDNIMFTNYDNMF